MHAIRNLKVGTKLTAFVFILAGVIMASLIVLIGYTTSARMEKNAFEQIGQVETGVTNMIGIFNQTADSDVSRFSKLLAASFTGPFTLDAARAVPVGGKPVPMLMSGATDLNLDFSIPDSFTARTGVTATIFARNGEDLVRVSTSVKKENGERAVGTMMDKAHPGYPLLMAGSVYSGLATLFGKPYITRYVPIKDMAGKVIGALYVGVDISADMATLKQRIKAITLGKTGYFYIVNGAAGKDFGTLVVHPTREGQNALAGVGVAAGTDVAATAAIKTMLEKKQGLLQYTPADAASAAQGERAVVYSYIKEWNWLVAGELATEEITAEMQALNHRFLGFGLAALLLFSGLLLLVVRAVVSRPLQRASTAAAQLAAGDLTVRLKVSNHDEIGQLMDAINGISRSLSGVVSDIRDGAERLAGGSAEIASGNLDLSARTEEQAASLEETASSMEELTATVRHNSDNARHANDLAVSASGTAARGGVVVAQVVETMDSINASAKKIVDIIAVIDGIAFQTNILALNAAVEAARAGEQGRGFAVVASEVRSLAQRSAAAAREIKTLIGDSVEKVGSGTRLVASAGSTMEEIVGSVRNVTNIMAEIMTASAEQSAGIEQVNRAVVEMEQVTQQNAALVEEAAAAAGALQEQAARLAQVVSVFQLDAGVATLAPAAVASRPLRSGAVTLRSAAGKPRKPTVLPTATRISPVPRSASVSTRKAVPVAVGEFEEF